MRHAKRQAQDDMRHLLENGKEDDFRDYARAYGALPEEEEDLVKFFLEAQRERGRERRR